LERELTASGRLKPEPSTSTSTPLALAPDGNPWNEIEDMPGYFGPKDVADLLRRDPILKAEYDRIHGDDAVKLPIELEMPSEKEMRKQIGDAANKVKGYFFSGEGETAERRKKLKKTIMTHADNIGEDGLSYKDLKSLWLSLAREGLASERATFMMGLEEIVKDFRSPIKIDREKIHDLFTRQIRDLYDDKTLTPEEVKDKEWGDINNLSKIG
jgi:hypothetical protein